MVNCTALVGTWEWIWNGKFRGKGRNSTLYGYYMLLIIAAARRTRPSQWTWSFNCPLSSNQHWEHGWRTSPGSRYLRTVDIHYHSTKHEVKSQFWIPRSGSVHLHIWILAIFHVFSAYHRLAIRRHTTIFRIKIQAEIFFHNTIGIDKSEKIQV